MVGFKVPERKYAKGDKEVLSVRLPREMVRHLREIADKKGWDFAELLITVLDQYIAFEKEKKGG